MSYKSFEDLEVWKRGCNLAVDVYVTFKSSKEYSLKDQMNRAAVSIPSNIAEGAERNTNPDFMRFLHIAKGSSAELRTQLYIAEKIGILETEKSKTLIEETKQLSAMLQGLINSLKG